MYTYKPENGQTWTDRKVYLNSRTVENDCRHPSFLAAYQHVLCWLKMEKITQRNMLSEQQLLLMSVNILRHEDSLGIWTMLDSCSLCWSRIYNSWVLVIPLQIKKLLPPANIFPSLLLSFLFFLCLGSLLPTAAAAVQTLSQHSHLVVDRCINDTGFVKKYI